VYRSTLVVEPVSGPCSTHHFIFNNHVRIIIKVSDSTFVLISPFPKRLVILVIYMPLWLGASLVASIEAPTDCLQIEHCTQIRVTIAFAWLTL
jgi:hypothetical protein